MHCCQPTRAEAEVGRGRAHRSSGIVIVAADHDFGAGSIVVDERDESTLDRPHRLDSIKHPAGLGVGAKIVEPRMKRIGRILRTRRRRMTQMKCESSVCLLFAVHNEP